MMQSLLSFITLYGLSFSVWGMVGLCRFVSERRDQIGSGPLRVWLVMASGAGATLMLSLPLAGEVLRSNDVQAWSVEMLLVLGLCGSLGSFVAARLFRIPQSGSAVLAFAAGYGLGAGAWAHFAGWDASVLTPGSLLPLFLLGISLLSGWSGLLFARIRATNSAAESSAASPPGRIGPTEVAVLIPAHNEGRSIGACLAAVTRILPVGSVYVASDGSTDNTVAVVREWGCNVAEINPGRGKAGALQELLVRFDICARYKAVLILDADSEVDPRYLEQALPLFDDPSVAAIAGHAYPAWQRHRVPNWGMFFVGYRVRLYKLTQALLRYGQTWRYANVSFIVPGFASMYRCSILPEIDITAQGLIIEDFNMTFEVHHKRLGKIAYSPRVRCMCQDPTNLADYIRQVKRWDLGLWQTIRRHGVWPSLFWLALAIFIVEVSLQSAVFLTVPFLLAWFVANPGEPLVMAASFGSTELQLLDVLVGVVLADYVLTVIVAALERKPMLLLYGIGFLIPRWIDAFLFLATLPLAFFVKSDGRWVSPQRS